jgi:phosphoserine phosphatase RsbU/P
LTGPGPLIGAFDEAEFKTRTVRLQPGDAVLFYTDGLEALLLDRGGPAPLDNITRTPWFAALSTRSLADSLAEIDQRLSDPAPRSSPPDDVTIVALRILP